MFSTLISNACLTLSYENPDLDGVACTYAYAEYLQKHGIDAKPGITGKQHIEADFITQHFHVPELTNCNDSLKEYEQLIIVDASNPEGLSKRIDLSKVVEVIDHRKYSNEEAFPNATFQIELVGAAATLVAEKFAKENIEISRESAILLYGAIVSNTINFQANVTTSRDHKMANWLLDKVDLPTDFVESMFKFKTSGVECSKAFILSDFYSVIAGDQTLGIGQIELIGAENFLSQNREDCLNILNTIKVEQQLDMVFLTLIDIEKGMNVFLVNGKNIQNALEKIFTIKFHQNIAHREGILLRKELIPMIKHHYLHKVINI